MPNLNPEGLLTFEKKVQLKPYLVRKPKSFDLMTDNQISDNRYSHLIVDSECYPNYFLIAFKHVKTGKIIQLEAPFDVNKLAWIMHHYTTVGFNSIKYDIPLIWYSYYCQNTELIKEVSNFLICGHAYEFKKEYPQVLIPETPHIDLIEVCPLRGSLKLYGARLHGKRIQDLPFPDYHNLSEEQKQIVSNYCINDLDLTELAFNNLTEQLKLRSDLTIEYKQNLMSKSDAQIAESVIGSELKKITGKWPKKPKIETADIHKFIVPENMFFQTERMQKVLEVIRSANFSVNENGRLEPPKEITDLKIRIGNGIYRMGIGGLHSSEENIAIQSNSEYQLYDRDVASYYPAIVLNLKLCPQHLGEDFLTVYQSLVSRRLIAKEAKNIAVSENLKVVINGTFGKTGSPYSILYAPEMTIQITVGGQLYLLMLIETLELRGISIVSANTDGIMIYCHKDVVPTMNAIIQWWEQVTGFKTEETKYQAIYSRDVNAYLAVKSVDEVKGKNVYYDPWRSKTAKDAYWRFQKNPNAQICIEAIEYLITKDIPIEKTITECRDITKFVSIKNVAGGAHKDGYYLGKVVRWYYAKNIVGTINYINTNNKVPDTEGARPCMDLPDNFPEDIDFDWYLKRTKELLTDMRYLKPQEQFKFF